MITFSHQDYEVLIGENKEENDSLVRESDDKDYWIHISEYPSAHGVIRNPSKKRVPLQVIKRVCVFIKERSSKCKSMKKLLFDVARIEHVKPTEKVGQVSVKQFVKQVAL